HDAEFLSSLLGVLALLVALLWAFAVRREWLAWVVLPGGGTVLAGVASLVQALLACGGGNMFQGFRQAMAWVHTWFGLVLGFVLMAAFFFGALSVFDREIDRWAIPATRFEPQPMPSFDAVLRPAFERIQPTPEAIEAMRPRVDG